MDPLTMPNLTLEIPELGDIKIHDGHLSGLGTIQRTGSNFICADDAGLKVQLDVGLEQMALNCGAVISTPILTQDVNISMNAERACISAKIKE
ncbi:hypothetical protein HPB49_008099 [Dermacentor silvarum]|uniref:Uncharacterized protein n=1 Tax=Dermacentor silvarum TaxID=543639 RepID=A0ACB8C896_DERSI|nr:hypothetical protein HPB49_008099 [Dermacentor silvarum]